MIGEFNILYGICVLYLPTLHSNTESLKLNWNIKQNLSSKICMNYFTVVIRINMHTHMNTRMVVYVGENY